MNKINWIHPTLIAILLLLASCGKSIYEEADQDDSKPAVYLSVTRAAHSNGTESINEDAIDFEDRVHDMMMLVFDSNTGALIGSYIDNNIPISETSKTFVVKLTPGQRDFYFVANMPLGDLTGITTRTEMDAYLKAFRDLDAALYLAASAAKGFPISRVYLNQTLTEGGRMDNPTLFRPGGEDKVLLRRAVAQLQVDLEGSAVTFGVKNIYYKNAYRQFSLESINNTPLAPAFYAEANGNPMKRVGNSYFYYMPEALMNTTPAWGIGDHKPINYFVIETTNGTRYEVPIITYEGVIAGGNYLKFARGEESVKPDWQIYRNRRYVYTVKNLQNIEIDYTIDPWAVVRNSLYMGYGYNVEVSDNGEVVIRNTVDACDPHNVVLKTVAAFKFADGTTEKSFQTLASDASSDVYLLNPVPQIGNGNYLQVWFNGKLVKTFAK